MGNHNFGTGFGDMSFLGRGPREIETTEGRLSKRSSVMNRNLSYFPTWIIVLEWDICEK